MKRASIFITLMSVMVLVFAGVALAAVIKGNDRANYLRGTSDGDGIYATVGLTASTLGAATTRCASAAARTKATVSMVTTLSIR